MPYYNSGRVKAPFDKAFIEMTLGQMIYNLDEPDMSNAISYIELAVSSGELNYKDHWKMYDFLINMKIFSGLHLDAVNMIISSYLEFDTAEKYMKHDRLKSLLNELQSADRKLANL